MTDEESEKMGALKKAYAEMILNTSKEAGRRVMEAEKIAIACKHHIFSTKHEALRLLVRLKHIIDAKIIESEIASSTQQTKINELEAQLQEAEGVILDLRQDLNCLRHKLETARANRFNPNVIMNDQCFHQNALPQSYVLNSNTGLPPLDATASDDTTRNASFSHGILDNKGCDMEQKQTDQSSVSPFEILSSRDDELVSVNLRNKEPELYRNGFTQRIRALGGNLLAGKLSPEVDEYSIVKSQLITGECNKDAKTNFEIAKSTSGEEVGNHAKVHSLRQRRTQFEKPKAKHKPFPSNLMRSYQPPSIFSRCKSYLASENSEPHDQSCPLPSVKSDNVNVKEVEEKLHCQSESDCVMDEKIIDHEGKGQKEVQSMDVISMPLTSRLEQHETYQPSSTLSHWKTRSLSLCDNIRSGEDKPEMTKNEVNLKSLPRLDPGLILIKGGVDPFSGFTNDTVSVKASNRCGISQDSANTNIKSVDESVRQKCGAATNSSFSCYKSNPDMVNVPLVYSDLGDLKASKDAMFDVAVLPCDFEDAKASDEPKLSPSEVNNKRLLKYTFQRKRKKEVLSSLDQNTLVENITVKRRVGGKQNDSQDTQICSMMSESSRDDQQPDQLISLSGKGWW